MTCLTPTSKRKRGCSWRRRIELYESSYQTFDANAMVEAGDIVLVTAKLPAGSILYTVAETELWQE